MDASSLKHHRPLGSSSLSLSSVVVGPLPATFWQATACSGRSREKRTPFSFRLRLALYSRRENTTACSFFCGFLRRCDETGRVHERSSGRSRPFLAGTDQDDKRTGTLEWGQPGGAFLSWHRVPARSLTSAPGGRRPRTRPAKGKGWEAPQELRTSRHKGAGGGWWLEEEKSHTWPGGRIRVRKGGSCRSTSSP